MGLEYIIYHYVIHINPCYDPNSGTYSILGGHKGSEGLILAPFSLDQWLIRSGRERFYDAFQGPLQRNSGETLPVSRQ